MAEINGVKVPFIPIVQTDEIQKNRIRTGPSGFDSIFKEELEKIKFSSHAAKRLEARNIQLSETELSKLQDAVEKAEMKGAKDSLVMMDNTAFIVNVPNKTVVTAMQLGDNDNIFTNIDSVVFTQ
ncbi:MAG: TIGR02530 family flagellar biosynthesis protein [Bacteroidota bacterium]|jgi:flagellar operon protein|nr:flagellar protein [Ignavibacteria bacterium]HEX2960373.1 TIGR02530 family flagellar biosynthesis protein [Ignavibacteriales bacterium]MCU7499309.1 flagellar protein [Ignavibacteria bacterium]MCU7512538.1 flagellar protein [Ignavibacteria bacterium]MCU7519684.1 flagellar protein [Ignavibacteria bacterium]